MRHPIVTVIVVSLVILVGSCGRPPSPPSTTPDEAFEDFLTNDERAEDQLMDPLILAGDDVVPLVLEAIANSELPRRRYAIHFLGNGRYAEATEALLGILYNSEERDYFRGDALAALNQIDSSLAQGLAEDYIERTDYLGRRARNIADGEDEYWYQRSYDDALRGRHD
jgi:hypothetical protein